MSGNTPDTKPTASSSKIRPPEPLSTPPPPPPPLPKPASFPEGANFVRLEDLSDDSGASFTDQAPAPSMVMKEKRKATENSKKRKSDALEDTLNHARGVRSKGKETAQYYSSPWMRRVRWEGCLNAAEMYASPSFRL
jgi:hypothetical protein